MNTRTMWMMLCLLSVGLPASWGQSQYAVDLQYLETTKQVVANASDEDDDAMVRRALEKRVDIVWKEIPLNDALLLLQKELKIQIVLDHEGFEEAGVTHGELVNLSLANVRVRNALKILLEPLHLNFVVRDGVLKITSEEKASEILSIRVYNVRDLVETPAPKEIVKTGLRLPVPAGTRVRYPGEHETEEQPVDYDTLIDLITTTVEPDAWSDNGGTGSVSAIHHMLVVSQTDEIHDQIQTLLNHLRAARDRTGITLP